MVKLCNLGHSCKNRNDKIPLSELLRKVFGKVILKKTVKCNYSTLSFYRLV